MHTCTASGVTPRPSGTKIGHNHHHATAHHLLLHRDEIRAHFSEGDDHYLLYKPDNVDSSACNEEEKLASLGVPGHIMTHYGLKNRIDPASVYGKLPCPVKLSTELPFPVDNDTD